MRRKLTISGIPAGATVDAICHGGGCPFARRAFPARDRSVSLTAAFKHHKLRPKTTLELEIIATDDVGQVTTYTIRKRRSPTITNDCVPPGANGPTACA
jgi:hypothetical protein